MTKKNTNDCEDCIYVTTKETEPFSDYLNVPVFLDKYLNPVDNGKYTEPYYVCGNSKVINAESDDSCFLINFKNNCSEYKSKPITYPEWSSSESMSYLMFMIVIVSMFLFLLFNLHGA